MSRASSCSSLHRRSRFDQVERLRGRVGVGVAERIECPLVRDLEFEALIDSAVDEFDRYPIAGLAPEERDLDPVRRTVGELAAKYGDGGHGGSFCDRVRPHARSLRASWVR